MSESDEEYLEDLSEAEAQAPTTYGTRSSKMNFIRTRLYEYLVRAKLTLDVKVDEAKASRPLVSLDEVRNDGRIFKEVGIS